MVLKRTYPIVKCQRKNFIKQEEILHQNPNLTTTQAQHNTTQPNLNIGLGLTQLSLCTPPTPPTTPPHQELHFYQK